MSKVYKQVLPFDGEDKIKYQFGFLPMSIIEPSKDAKARWSIAYLDDGIIEQRRSEDAKYLPGLRYSEFHAELAENVIRYWSLKGATVVDPFSGRATRAVVTSKLGRNYVGYEISPVTYQRVTEHLNKHSISAQLFNSDGTKLNGCKNESADLVFTCPPYHGLEKYESVDGQLSDIDKYDDFLKKIEETFINVKRVLKPGAFFVWVVGDWRDGITFRSFSSDSINLAKSVGLKHHDTIIMKNLSPFAPLQLGKVAASRYTSKIHEYILVFRKQGEYDYSWYTPDESNNKFF
jgi:DNA modification methylase